MERLRARRLATIAVAIFARSRVPVGLDTQSVHNGIPGKTRRNRLTIKYESRAYNIRKPRLSSKVNDPICSTRGVFINDIIKCSKYVLKKQIGKMASTNGREYNLDPHK